MQGLDKKIGRWGQAQHKNEGSGEKRSRGQSLEIERCETNTPTAYAIGSNPANCARPFAEPAGMRSVSVGAGHEYGGEEGRIDKLAGPGSTTHTAHAGCLGDVDQEFAQRSRSRKQGDRDRGSRRRWPKIEERQTNAGRSAEGPGADAACTDESGEGNGQFVRGRSGICRRHRIGTGGGRGGRIWRELRGRRSRSNGARSHKLHGWVSSQRRSRGETDKGKRLRHHNGRHTGGGDQ